MSAAPQYDERRVDPRAAVSLLASLNSDAGENPVMVVELSPLGVRIQTEDPPDNGRHYELHFTVHGQAYDTRLRVVHWTGNDGAYHWGCLFVDLQPQELERLRRAVYAATGQASTSIREWAEIEAEAEQRPRDHILVGQTPAGQDIRLAARDCVELGQQGVELFVSTVASLENAG
ncbi:MAG TPA: PilZ domain-containing protein [Chloroflexota bacterium]|nr:PilZ domain-containing protein [Chloroflexota bacterium]